MKFTIRDLLIITTFLCAVFAAIPAVLSPLATQISEQFWKSVTDNPTTYKIARSILE